MFYFFILSPHYSFNFHFYNLLLPCKKKRKTLFLKQTSYIYIMISVTLFVCFSFSLILYFWEANLFGICYQPLRTQSLVPIFTWERDHWPDCSLFLLTLLFLYQVASISPYPLLFSTQLGESLCVFWAVENT